jgi:hypothetical protein
MMKDADLQTFNNLVKVALIENRVGPFRSPAQVLKEEVGLFSSEIWRLSRSLRIGAAADEVDERTADAADHIWEELKHVRCAPLLDGERWKEAVNWALARGRSQYTSGKVFDRQQRVGLAYKRLKQQQFTLSLGAYGISFTEQTQREIFRKADALAFLIGGANVLLQLCAIMASRSKIHDGMWLLGDQVPNVMQSKTPSLPIAWLFALGARHLGRLGKARKPDQAWRTLIELATNMAACLDCERYNQFEGMDMHPTQFWRSMTDSLMWREFFTLPQVPSVVVGDILLALLSEVASLGSPETARYLEKFSREAKGLIRSGEAGRLGRIEKTEAKRLFPTLCDCALGKIGAVNASIDSIFSAGNRNHESCILFETSESHYIYLPSPLLGAAICEQAFTYVWRSLPAKASKIVGNTMERALAAACQGKAPILETTKKYKGIEGMNLEMDVGSRSGDVIVLIETKAKSLTAASRTAAGFSYISDYTKSYLAMIKQLMLHEKSIRNGANPLVTKDDKCDDFRPIKVAVSPLSYGQLSDKLFASSIVRGMFNSTLNVVPDRDTSENQKIIADFNDAMAEVRMLIGELAPKSEGLADLAPYLLDFFWLDLGQALYVIKRGKTMPDAFRPISRITFSTRDFWTEVATAERGGMTGDRWHASA